MRCLLFHNSMSVDVTVQVLCGHPYCGGIMGEVFPSFLGDIIPEECPDSTSLFQVPITPAFLSMRPWWNEAGVGRGCQSFPCCCLTLSVFGIFSIFLPSEFSASISCGWEQIRHCLSEEHFCWAVRQLRGTRHLPPGLLVKVQYLSAIPRTHMGESGDACKGPSLHRGNQDSHLGLLRLVNICVYESIQMETQGQFYYCLKDSPRAGKL